ncbi:hypothetical protein FOA24_21370 [Bacillus thuringiensis]|uniref:hypothetical protein n=1 Tax=Bacillus thuringiensis TaxID=1428 RepID=UPI0033371CD9
MAYMVSIEGELKSLYNIDDALDHIETNACFEVDKSALRTDLEQMKQGEVLELGDYGYIVKFQGAKETECPLCKKTSFNYKQYIDYYCNNPEHAPKRIKKGGKGMYGIYLKGELMETRESFASAAKVAQFATEETGIMHIVKPLNEKTMDKAKVIELIANVIFDASKSGKDYKWMCELDNSLDKLGEELDVSNEEIYDTVLKLNGPDPVAISKTKEGTYKRTLVEMHYPWDMIKDWSEEDCEAEIGAIDSSDVM